MPVIYIDLPFVNVTPTNPTVLENSFIVLSCNCACSLQPHWFKNNQSFRYDERASPYTLLANGSLRINVSRHTAGNYSCEIRSGYSFARSKQIRLKVRCKYASVCIVRAPKLRFCDSTEQHLYFLHNNLETSFFFPFLCTQI